MLTQLGRWCGWLFHVPRAFLFPPRWPNQRLQSTPLAASEIGAILTVRICYNHIAVYRCGAAEAQHVGHQPSNTMLLEAPLLKCFWRTKSAIHIG
jgi:hypothetical protein